MDAGGLLRMACIACSTYQQSAHLSCQEILVWSKVPSYLFGRRCNKTQSKRFQSVGEGFVVRKDGPNVAERANNLGPDAKSSLSISRAQIRSG